METAGEIVTIPSFARSLVDRYADREAIVLGEHRLTFRELDRGSRRLARGLLAEGVGKGSRVGILMGNGPDWLLAFFAATRIGAIAVPINTFFQAPELSWVLRHADINALLLPESHLGHDLLARLCEAVPGLSESKGTRLAIAAFPFLRTVVRWGVTPTPWALDGAELAAGQDKDYGPFDDTFLASAEQTVEASDALAILYTSGSTGDPKGVVHTQGTLLRHSHRLVSTRDLGPEDVVWSPMPFFWVGGLVFGLLGNLHVGATTLCEFSFEPEQTLALLERERVTVALGWPHFGKAMAEHPSLPQRDLSALRAGNLPGILPESAVSPDPELRPNALGMTETAGPHTVVPDGVLPESLRSTFGRPVAGVEHRIVDPDTGTLQPPGVPGEIHVRGYSLMQGLYKRERDSTFLPDGFYPTGDIGSFDDAGVLRFLGRRGEMIKTAGANVTPSEVEKAFADIEGVQQAFVVGVPDPDRGQNVAAAVVGSPDSLPTAEELRAQLKKTLSAYKIPRHLVFYPALSDLPFTDSGKLDRVRLVDELVARIARAGN